MRHKADFVNVVASFLAMTNWMGKLERKRPFIPGALALIEAASFLGS